MTYNAKILADSISEAGVRLTTMEVTFPRFILPEFNTHRMFSRNSASSRAIPVEKMIQRVKENPFIPEYWGANRPGMQAWEEIPDELKPYAEKEWKRLLEECAGSAEYLAALGLHKQIANRVIELFSWHTVIVSATEWENFFRQRCHPKAQPEIRRIAELMREELILSVPQLIQEGEWHLPLTPDLYDLTHQYDIEDIKKISAARCARVSFLTHDGLRDTSEDLRLYNKLFLRDDPDDPPHFSPFEHVATPDPGRHGNFNGWRQMRQDLEEEIALLFFK